MASIDNHNHCRSLHHLHVDCAGRLFSVVPTIVVAVAGVPAVPVDTSTELVFVSGPPPTAVSPVSPPPPVAVV